MLYDNKIWVGGSTPKCLLKPSMTSRHGLISGAIGTGKSVTMKVLAEGFSDLGIPVFMTDVKGDVSGICAAGVTSDDMEDRIFKCGIEDFVYKAYPTTFYDCFGISGIPLRTTVSEMGPKFLGRMMGLTNKLCETLSIVFGIADYKGLLLLDLKDLRMLLIYLEDHITEYRTTYGITFDEIDTILSKLLYLSDRGGDGLFSEPAFDIFDLFRIDSSGRGMVNVFGASEIMKDSLIYTTFLCWILNELCDNIPNIDSPENPKLVVFIEETQLFFSGTSAFPVEQMDRMLQMLRWKGIGVFFVTAMPTSIPGSILSKLENRIHHAQYAVSASERKKIETMMSMIPSNPIFDKNKVLEELADGEALLSFLNENGTSEIVSRSSILPPQSFIGSAGFEKIQEETDSNPLYEKYRLLIDPESAFDILLKRYE